MELLIIVFWILACPALGPACSWWAWVGGSPVLLAILVLMHPVLAAETLSAVLTSVLTLLVILAVVALTVLAGMFHRHGVWLRRLGAPEAAPVAEEWPDRPAAVAPESDVHDHLRPERQPGPPLPVIAANQVMGSCGR